MKFTVNVACMGNSFPFPRDVAEKYLKLASPVQLKVIIHCFAHLNDKIDKDEIASAINVPSTDVEEALIFWSNARVLNCDNSDQKSEEAQVVVKQKLPNHTDVLRRGMEDKNIMLMLREAQMRFGRNLKDNESSLLVSLYDDNGMKVSVILMLLQYAANKGKCNVSFIRSTAVSWLKAGVETVADAEKEIKKSTAEELAWREVMRIFGIEKRKPSEKESELSNLWLNEWKISEELLKAAYDTCVNAKSKVSFSYIAAVLESWHKKGIKTKDEIEKASDKRAKESNDYGGFDIDLFYEMANKD